MHGLSAEVLARVYQENQTYLWDRNASGIRRCQKPCRRSWAIGLGQVWAEAQAYENQCNLATGEIAALQQELVNELRRIGNNLNQLARLGHIHNRKHGVLSMPDSGIAAQTMRQLAELEEAVAKFDDGMKSQRTHSA